MMTQAQKQERHRQEVRLYRQRKRVEAGLPPVPHKKTLKERFDEKVDRSAGPDACWPWTGYVARGYGRIVGPNGKLLNAARVAVELATGKPLLKTERVHSAPSCRPLCMNPAHLTVRSTREQ